MLTISAALCLFLGVSTASSVEKRWVGTTDPLDNITLEAPDGSIKGNWIPYGAITTNLWVPDRNGTFRDILLGFDNHTNYMSDDLGHPYFAPIVGRYANRIKNSTFTIRNETYNIVANENNGLDTLHGGSDGFDRRQWNVTAVSGNSVTFFLADPAGMEGFPGAVNTTVEYTLLNNSLWKITMHATASELTPIMLSGHHYWNFEAYQETQDLSGHYAQFDSSRVVHTDGILIPDGPLINTTGTALDFSAGKSIATAINETEGYDYCGTGCTGIDNCFIYDQNNGTVPVLSVWSVNSGIKLDVITDQTALQIYTCNTIYSETLPIPRKSDQGGGDNSTFYQDHSCFVLEQESWIDAINQPEWNINQVYSPDRPYSWEASYQFSTFH